MAEQIIQVGARAVIFNADNELLVEHRLRPEEDYYYLPGGGVYFHEKIEDCLVREVKEETGLDVRTERLLWVRDFVEGSPVLHGIEMFFLATITGGKFTTQNLHDTEPIESSFMKIEELERILFYPTSFIPKLKKLRDNRDWSETNVYMRSAP